MSKTATLNFDELLGRLAVEGAAGLTNREAYALVEVAKMAHDLVVNGWAMWESDNPEVVKREDTLIDALARFEFDGGGGS